MTPEERVQALIDAAADLRDDLEDFSKANAIKVLSSKGVDVGIICNPFQYAMPVYEEYIGHFAKSTKEILFVGMNPSRDGMVHTCLPFCDPMQAKSLMRYKMDEDSFKELIEKIKPPFIKKACRACKHCVKKSCCPVKGFDYDKTERSGKQFWRLINWQYGSAENFFKHHFVINYCPLLFTTKDFSKNISLETLYNNCDKTQRNKVEPLFTACNTHLKAVINALEPKWIVAMGIFTEKMVKQALLEEGGHCVQLSKKFYFIKLSDDRQIKLVAIQHPRNARQWPYNAQLQMQPLIEAGVWPNEIAATGCSKG